MDLMLKSGFLALQPTCSSGPWGSIKMSLSREIFQIDFFKMTFSQCLFNVFFSKWLSQNDFIKMALSRWLNQNILQCFLYIFFQFQQNFAQKLKSKKIWAIWSIFLLKPNYFKKIFNHHLYLLTRQKWSTRQASFMHLRHETSLLSTPWQFWTCIFTSGK